jgi:PhnB protein
MNSVKSLPNGYHTVIPYLTVQGAERLIEFMERVFEANVTERMTRPDGTIGHADVRIGDSVIMLSEASSQWPAMPGALHLYLEDADAAYRRALQAGAASLMEPADQAHGDRMAGVKDPFGNVWWMATHVEDLSSEEMKRRTEESWKQ